jgi:hypothetical protein
MKIPSKPICLMRMDMKKIKKQHKLKKSTARPNLDWNRKDLRI